jgi:TetR/AcrR family transcriptional regulator, repressor for uid operon
MVSKGPTSRDLQRHQTREAVFLAALEEFFAVGVAEARIDRIVEKAGVARGTFYFHFPTKEHVLYELTDRTEAMIAESIDVAENAPLGDVIRATFNQIRGSMQAISGELRRELLAAQMRRPQDVAPTPMLIRLSRAVDEAKRIGAVRAELNSLDVARTLLTGAFGAIALAPNDDAASTALELLADIALRGVVVEGAHVALNNPRTGTSPAPQSA